MELATNCDGSERKGKILVQESARISDFDESKINDCWGFYSRTKHLDRNPEDEKKYQKGFATMGEKIIYLRKATQKIITSRLKSIA